LENWRIEDLKNRSKQSNQIKSSKFKSAKIKVLKFYGFEN